MGQALYRKYRPRKFSEAIGQEAIVKTLKDAIKSSRISHAYLFAGPRGVGKTSIARILAHEVNALPYSPDSTHLDIIEIDAASNRRIDEIRDLREKVHITPTSAKYKVYIIDEVHMLTKEAFNALLKTLEEPPAHIIFILATTEPHKLPETIISRTQRFNFKPINSAETKSHIQKIASSEKIEIDTNALSLLADYGDGSLRDIIGLLDQLSSTGKKITEADVRNLLGIPPQAAINQLIESVSDGQPQTSLKTLEELKLTGSNPVTIARILSQHLRRTLLNNEISGKWVNTLLKQLLEVSASTQPQEALELNILDAAMANLNKTRNMSSDENSMSNRPRIDSPRDKMEPGTSKSPDNPGLFRIEQWDDLVEQVKTEAPSLYTALRLAKPSISDDTLNLAFPFAFHQKKAKEAKHISIIAKVISEISGSQMIVRCVVNKELAQVKSAGKPDLGQIIKLETTEKQPDLEAISSIFGSAEVLES